MMKRATRRLLERMSSIYKILQETFQGIRVVKAFTMEPYERRRFRAATKDYYHKAMMRREHRRPGRADHRGAGRGGGRGGAAGRRLPGARTTQTHLFGMRMTEQPLEARGAAAALRPAGGHRRPGAQAVERLHASCKSGAAAADRIFSFMDRQPKVRRQQPGPPPGAAPRRHRVPRRLLLLRAGPADPDQHQAAASARRDHRPGRQERLRQDARWSACCRASTIPTTARS